MEKDIITVLQEDGTKKDMEVVLLYKEGNTNYILYKEIDNSDECYAAKYLLNNDIYELDTNLTKKEISKLEILLNSTLKENN